MTTSTPSTPHALARAVNFTEWSVSFDPVPAMTGMVTADATARHRSHFSSSERTELSPVDPLSTRPSLP